MGSIYLLMVFVPIIIGFLPLAIRDVKKLNAVAVLVSVIEFAACVYLIANFSSIGNTEITVSWFAGMGINFKATGFGVLQAAATGLIWVGSSVFSNEYFNHDPKNLPRYYSFWMITFGATIGLFLSADLFTAFIFFEVMSFASYPLVAHNQDAEAVKAGNSYLSIAVIGGLATLTGIFILFGLTGTVEIARLAQAVQNVENKNMLFVVAVLVFFGFAAKAGMFPLHGWLPKAHPAAPAPASAALSGILIKSGVFGVIVVTCRIMQGNIQWAAFLLVLALLTMFVGAVCAFCSTNLKETLAYSSMSQIGFITTGVAMTQFLGEHGAIAAYGTVLHMINHTMIKLVLFTCAGIIYQNTHTLDLNKLQGFGKGKKVLTACFAVAALGIMGVPLFNGYISKTLIHESMVEYMAELSGSSVLTMFKLAEGLFLLSGGFTVAYMTKLFICLFVKQPVSEFSTHGSYVTKRTSVVISLVSAVIFIFGVLPHQTMVKLAAITVEFMGTHTLDHEIAYFSLTNLKGAVISIVAGIILYFVVAKYTVMSKEKGYVNPLNPKYSLENAVWKPLVFDILPFIFGFIARIIDKITDAVVYVLKALFMRTAKIPQTFFTGRRYAEDEETSSPAFHVGESLAYSLLLFGIGLVVTIFYLLLV